MILVILKLCYSGIMKIWNGLVKVDQVTLEIELNYAQILKTIQKINLIINYHKILEK